jgi:hypothetical protein
MDELNLAQFDAQDGSFVEIDVLTDDAAELSAEAICACGCGMGGCIRLCILFAQEQ